MSMTITFEPILDNYGFDDSAFPPWMMVGVRSSLPIWVLNAAGATVVSRSPGIASVAFEEPTPNQGRFGSTQIASTAQAAQTLTARRIMRIKGHAVGRTTVDISQAGRVVGQLEVAVKPAVTLSITFHFVSDSATPVAHSTQRTPAELREMMAILNGIYTPQTNIQFVMRRDKPLKLKGDLGAAVNFNMNNRGEWMRGHEWSLVTANRDPSAHINVFFVWRNEFRLQNERGRIVTSGAIGYVAGDRRDILIQDWDGMQDRNEDGDRDMPPSWENARMLAHEIGHVLGIDDVKATRRARRGSATNRWMFPAVHGRVNVNDHYVLGSGPFIPKAHANIMSSIAQQIAGR
jgi:hypothetical protein